MEYRIFLAVLLVLCILSVGPAGAVEIGSSNQVKYPNTLNSRAITQSMVKENTVVNQDLNKGLHKLKTHVLSDDHKKNLKLSVNKVKGHKSHKLSRNSLATTYNKGKQSHGFSHKFSTKNSNKSVESRVISDDKNTKSSEINISNSADANTTVLDNATGINGIDSNQKGNESFENETVSSQTFENETNVNGTILNNSTDENKTDFNETGNGTLKSATNINDTALNNVTGVNETNLSKTDNSNQDSPTKTHTLNTIENAGYALAAIAGCFAVGIAVAPEGITKTICVVGAVVCGVAAAACFVAHAIASWFDW